jgi:PII-like signaling protein
MSEQWNTLRDGEIMKGYQLTFYTLQSSTHEHRPIHQWLMELAKSMEIHGATVLTAQEGLGAHHRLHSARFFELADQPVEVVMAVSETECDTILQRLRLEPGLRVFYSRTPIEFGTIGVEE